MDSALENQRSLLWLGLSLVVSSILIFQAGELWLADRRIHSNNYELMSLGANLTPGNGEAWDRLGRYNQLNFASPDPSAAILNYQRALQDDPRSSTYWMDLGSAYEDTGDIGKAREAYERGVAVYPISAAAAWNYGNFLLRQQDYENAYPQIRRAVSMDSSLLPLAISRTWRATGNIDELIDKALPRTADAYWQTLDFFVSINRVDLGLAIWPKLLDLKTPLPLNRSFAFLDALIADNRAADAHRIWTDALSASGSNQPQPVNPSLLSDGNFTAAFANGGLGWRWNPAIDASIDFDEPSTNGEGRSLRVDFEGGSNLDLSSPAQYVAVDPSRKYRFQGSIRTEGITTDSGVRFSIVDPNHLDEVNIASDNFRGSRPWTKVTIDVTSAENTHFLVVRLLRAPSTFFDNKISGSAWIAALSLVPLADTSAGSSKP
jgi:tetratricopeptide (TPR) repeat protein